VLNDSCNLAGLQLGLFQKLSSGGWVGGNGFFLSGGWMHNNVKFVLRDENIQVWWGSWYSDLSWGVGVCAFLHVLGMEKSKKLPPTPLRIISGTTLGQCTFCYHSELKKCGGTECSVIC